MVASWEKWTRRTRTRRITSTRPSEKADYIRRAVLQAVSRDARRVSDARAFPKSIYTTPFRVAREGDGIPALFRETLFLVGRALVRDACMRVTAAADVIGIRGMFVHMNYLRDLSKITQKKSCILQKKI